MNDSVITNINMPVVKAGSAIGAAVTANTDVAQSVATSVVTNLAGQHDPWWVYFVTSLPWGSIASMLAATYTGVLLCEWMWKKVAKPLLIELGWMKPPVRRVLTAQEISELTVETDSAPL